MSTPSLQQAINAILEQSDISNDGKIEALLKFGLQQLNLDVAIVSSIKDDRYIVNYFYPPESGLSQGQVFDYSKTYCHITVKLRQVVAINPMYSSEYKAHPCYEIFRLEAYIGVSLVVGGKFFGTLNFSSATMRPTPFTKEDREVMTKLSAAIGVLLEPQPENLIAEC